MSKMLVETTGTFNLMDLTCPGMPQYVNHFRPAVVHVTSQIEHLLQFQKLKKIEDLHDDAKDLMLHNKSGDELATAIKALPRPSKK